LFIIHCILLKFCSLSLHLQKRTTLTIKRHRKNIYPKGADANDVDNEMTGNSCLIKINELKKERALEIESKTTPFMIVYQINSSISRNSEHQKRTVHK